jgi:hypothetical protein
MTTDQQPTAPATFSSIPASAILSARLTLISIVSTVSTHYKKAV